MSSEKRKKAIKSIWKTTEMRNTIDSKLNEKNGFFVSFLLKKRRSCEEKDQESEKS